MIRSMGVRSFGLAAWTLAWLACSISVGAHDAAHASVGALDALAASLQRLRGVGSADVSSYRVRVDVEDAEEETAALLETWRAPADLTLRAWDSSTPTAIVRSLALYLEPLYVARSSLLDAELTDYAQQLERSATVQSSERSAGGRIVRVSIPDDATDLPEVFHDVRELRAEIDERGRLLLLDLTLREQRQGETELALQCTYTADDPQPGLVKWSLPSGEEVRVATEFRDEAGHWLPSARTIVFPSRFDPGEKEEIRIRYGAYELNPAVAVSDHELAASHAFRYDEDGLRAD